MMATYSSTEALDIWEKLGNKGWAAKDLRPYLHKFQTWNRPSEEIEEFFENRVLKPLPDFSYNPDLRDLAVSV